jgi:phosphopantothenoylcysteine decarboxylase/phosphopantothenate--cysteine ligase
MIHVKTADEMAKAVLQETDKADLLIMAAAVADYRPAKPSTEKIKKDRGGLNSIELETTPDILKEVTSRKKKKASGPGLTVGFAAETDDILKNAQKKMEDKDLDLIIANDVSGQDAGIGADQNQVTVIWKDGKKQEYPQMDKFLLSEILIEEIARLM